VSFAVVDASVLTAFYATDDPRRPEILSRFRAGNAMFAPAHLDAEVASALRAMSRRTPTLLPAMRDALRHLAGLPIRRMPLAPLLDRMWDLRDNITPYDAAYVALSEQLNAPLITCDAKLVASPGAKCAFDLIG
jgi:predicted nucleic acid-binding protein